jgi:hypothetical protein
MACQRQHRRRRSLRLAALGRAPSGRTAWRLAGCALALAGTGWLTAVPAAAAPAVPALAAAVSSDAARAHPWIAITSMTPTIAHRKGKVTVSGIIANPAAAPLAGLSVQLWSSSIPMASRQSMGSYLAGQPDAALAAPVPGALLTLPSRVPAHGTHSWSLTMSVAQAGMRRFGAYPLAAQLTRSGTELDVARTFLPFWPGKPAARTVKPLNIGWVWPLIDVPQRGACLALLTNDLAGSVAPGGRLATLLAAGQSADGRNARLTWAIDPALLSDVSVMKAPYRVGAREDCAGGKSEPPSHSAGGWLSGVKAVTAQQDFFVTPYADVDLAAMAHRGLTRELTHAFNDGHAEAQNMLERTQRATRAGAGQMAWPAGGLADYGVLEELAAYQQVRAVILDSRLMPPSPPVNYTPTAATTTPDGIGAQMNVLLADHGLGEILALRRNQIPGVTPGPTAMPASARGQILEAAAFAKEQLFLAETAMIAAEPVGASRAVVAAPPRRWNPSPSLAAGLLQDTVDTPWLRPATLASLAAAAPSPRSPGSPARRHPPGHQVGSGELSGALLRQVHDNLVVQVGLLDSILGTRGHGYLSTAVDAVESSAWRGGKRDQRPAAALLRRELAFVEAQLRQVKIVGSPRVTLGGKAGDVPVSIRNNLPQPVTVRLKVSAPAEDQIVIGHYKSIITVPGGKQVTVRVPVQAAAAGSKALSLSLTTPTGAALPTEPVSLTVTATHFGTLAIVIISVALVVFVLSAAARAIRRGGPQDGGAGEGAEAEELDPMPSTLDPATEGGETGSVGSGNAQEPQPAREDDEHATAPGRPDRR